jgi:hypothetical protein
VDELVEQGGQLRLLRGCQLGGKGVEAFEVPRRLGTDQLASGFGQADAKHAPIRRIQRPLDEPLLFQAAEHGGDGVLAHPLALAQLGGRHARSVVALLVGIEPDENPEARPGHVGLAQVLGGDGLVQVGGATHPPGQLHAGRVGAAGKLFCQRLASALPRFRR